MLSPCEHRYAGCVSRLDYTVITDVATAYKFSVYIITLLSGLDLLWRYSPQVVQVLFVKEKLISTWASIPQRHPRSTVGPAPFWAPFFLHYTEHASSGSHF